MDQIAADFFAAYERLVAGKPRNRNLRKKAEAGRLRINISSVALEAGRSRTLIALDDCRYPEVRARILGHKQPTGPARSADEAIEKWLRNFGRLDKWIVCLTTGTVVPANQEKS